jgi:hypothetical protein
MRNPNKEERVHTAQLGVTAGVVVVTLWFVRSGALTLVGTTRNAVGFDLLPSHFTEDRATNSPPKPEVNGLKGSQSPTQSVNNSPGNTLPDVSFIWLMPAPPAFGLRTCLLFGHARG